jgi:DNA polymerase I
VTAIGREILATMRDWLMSQGAQIIELDTDGIYFSPPNGITIEGLQSGLSAQLPTGIEVEFDSQYQAMFSYKAKNAAFLLEDGRLIAKGGALRSRGREPVLRRYLQDTLRMLLERRQDNAGKLFDSYTQAISSRTLPIEDLCKSQTLHTTLEDYRLAVKAGSRNREAAFELALRSATPFSVGDRLSYYITAGKGPSYGRAHLASNWNPLSRDEDVRYYLKQLEDVAKLFDEFTPGRSRQGMLL